MQLLALAFLLTISLDNNYRLQSAQGLVELVRGTEIHTIAGGEKPFQMDDRLILGPKATAVISRNAEVALLSGPGELTLHENQLRWSGRQIAVTSGEQSLQLILDEGMLQLSGAEVRVRREKSVLYIETLKGDKVAFVSAGGLTAIPAKKGIRVSGPRNETQPLLSPPKPLYPAPHQALRAFRFRWQPVDKAAAYHIEVAADPLFSELIYANDVTLPVYAEGARALPIGLLFWRVTARAADGFLGISSEPQAARVAP